MMSLKNYSNSVSCPFCKSDKVNVVDYSENDKYSKYSAVEEELKVKIYDADLNGVYNPVIQIYRCYYCAFEFFDKGDYSDYDDFVPTEITEEEFFSIIKDCTDGIVSSSAMDQLVIQSIIFALKKDMKIFYKEMAEDISKGILQSLEKTKNLKQKQQIWTA
ncbi:MAG: hypothetical protein FWE36_08145 [Erysipelotrichales bacterium]|nr:hypothetical protein [Erysipelotrichales bacterium]